MDRKSMERKRKLPARAAREPASKRRTTITPEPPSKATPPPPPVQEPLPKSISAGKPLPVVDQPQSEKLSSAEYQSVSESGVLVESLNRSRQKWLSEGIFERYWTKPTKKKGGPDLTNNPGKDTMTKLGTCTITVEPHVFDAVMYAIKDPNPKQPLAPPPQAMYRPIIQYGPPNGMMPPPPSQGNASHQGQFGPSPSMPLNASTTAQIQSRPPSVGGTFSPAPNNTNTSGLPVDINSSNMPSVTSNGHLTSQQSNPQAASAQTPKQSQPSTHAVSSLAPATSVSGHSSAASPAPAPATKSTDPVIQMLAERAATDPDLKALMRIVANGEASPDELKKFQGHIDDLTRLSKSRQAAAQPPQTSINPAAHPQANHKPSTDPQPHITPVQAPAVPQFPSQPQALRSKGPVSSKPDISGVVFEFTGGSGDRFLFPRYSILEYLPAGQVIVSFLIVRKGSSSDSTSYDPELDYYQPITIRLFTQQTRQLESLAKVVAPPDEVRRYMDDIMENMTRAEYVLLAMRLPRDVDQATTGSPREESEIQEKDQAEQNGVLWATTTQDVPVKHPPKQALKKLLTEEEKYQSFIQTVSM